MSFSVADVRDQLRKLGYENVPDQVIDKFMKRMKQQHEQQNVAAGTITLQQQQQPTQPQYDIPTSSGSSYSQLQQQPHTTIPPVPLSHPAYSSFAHPLTTTAATQPHPPPSSSMQHNFRPYTATVTTAPTHQHQVISRDTQPSRSAASSSSSPAVVVEDVKEDDGTEDGDDDDEYGEYYHRKQREIEELEARLKRHAEVAHQTIIGHRAAAEAMKAKQETSSPGHRHSQHDNEGDIHVSIEPIRSDRDDDENAVEQVRSGLHATRIGDGRGFGTSRRVNAQADASTHDATTKPWAQQRPSTARSVRGSASARSLSFSQQPSRGSLRPSTAQSRKSRSSGAAASSIPAVADDLAFEDALAAAEREQQVSRPSDHQQIEVVEVDTQRSLRKTYSQSLRKYKTMNPRYGAGGYRKSDPVTRYHAFKNKWDSSHFLNKKTTSAGVNPKPAWQT